MAMTSGERSQRLSEACTINPFLLEKLLLESRRAPDTLPVVDGERVLLLASSKRREAGAGHPANGALEDTAKSARLNFRYKARHSPPASMTSKGSMNGMRRRVFMLNGRCRTVTSSA